VGHKKQQDGEMTDQEYAEFQQLLHFDAASLRALALWLNSKRKNHALMKASSAEMGRNARHLARAVDFFRPHFTDEFYYMNRTASEYLMLFEFAKLKRELAGVLFAKYHFSTPLYLLRQVIENAKPKRVSCDKEASLAERCERVRSMAQAWKDGESSEAELLPASSYITAMHERTEMILAALDAAKTELVK
jgi:hypothetical protein